MFGLPPATSALLFDHLVGAREKYWWDGEAQSLCSFCIYDQLIFGRGLLGRLPIVALF